MKWSTLRCSFDSIQWSALKVPAVPSPRGITQATLAEMSETSKWSTFFAPLWPARRRFQVSSTPQASGETMPIPVTTTRLITSPQDTSRRTGRTGNPLRTARRTHRSLHESDSERALAPVSALRILLEKLHRVADGEDGFGG